MEERRRGKTGPVLECDTCRRPFGHAGASMPRVLPSCTHTYCHTCLSSLAEAGGVVALPGCGVDVRAILCPMGCGATPVGAAGAAALPPNNVLIARLTGKQGDREVACCEECEGAVPADMWCENCDAYFCRVHFANMHTTKVGRRHKVLKAAERPIHKHSRCALHAGQDIVLYCRSCKEAVCRDCCSSPFNGRHAACDVVSIESAADDAAATLRESIKTLRGHLLNGLRESGREVQFQIASVDVLLANRTSDIEKAFDYAEKNVVAALRERRQQVVSRLKEASIESRQLLTSQAEEIGAAAVGLATTCSETEMELRGSPAAALRRSQQLNSRLAAAKDQAELCRLSPTCAFTPPTQPVATTTLASLLCSTVQDYSPVDIP